MFLSLKVTDCQSSNLSKALAAFEVKAILSWKVGIMPFTFGIKFLFHLICCLAKETFTLASFSLHILRILEPSSRWLYNKAHHTDVSVLWGFLSKEGWSVGGGCAACCFLSLKSFYPLSLILYLRRLMIEYRLLLHSSSFHCAICQRASLKSPAHVTRPVFLLYSRERGCELQGMTPEYFFLFEPGAEMQAREIISWAFPATFSLP